MINERDKFHPAIIALLKGIKRDTYFKLFLFNLLFLVSLFAALFFIDKSITILFICLFGIVVSLFHIIKNLRYIYPEYHPVIRQLYDAPENIVWVYGMITKRLPFGIQLIDNSYLYFYLADGRNYTISIPQKKLKMVSRKLNQYLPQTTFGFTEERAKLYHEDPISLRKDT